MLKQIHKHQKLTVVVLAILAGSMLFFGVDLGGGGETYALKINEEEVSYADFTRERQALSTRLRQEYGQAYDLLAQNPNWSLNQQVNDSLVPKILLTQKAELDDIHTSDQEVAEQILSYFPNGNYKQYLSYSGTSAKSFEEGLRRELKRMQVLSFIQTMTSANEEEGRELWREENKQFNIAMLRLTLEDAKKEVKEASNEDLQVIYEENAADFETEPEVSYSYLEIGKTQALDLIEVTQDDIELYFAEHESDFRHPRSAKAQHIQLSFSASASPPEIAATKQTAEEVLGKAVAGADFSKLVAEYSDDVVTKADNGNLGWLVAGTGEPAIQEAVFALSEPGFAKLVRAPYGYHIIKVLEFKDGALKTIEEVTPEITKIIKDREAPAYASIYAAELYDEWEASGTSLEEFAVSKKLEAGKTELLKAGVDPQGLSGVTSELIQFNDNKKQLIERDVSSFLVEILDVKEKEIPEFEVVKAKVEELFKNQEAEAILNAKALDIEAALTEGKSLEEVSKEFNIALQMKDKLTKLGGGGVELQNPNLLAELFSVQQAPFQATQGYDVGSDKVFYKVRSIALPDDEDFSKVKENYINRKSSDNQQLIVTALTNKLKNNAEIDTRVDL